VSLKDELQHVKEELSGDEKILESAFKLERVYKKYKYLIWGVAFLLIAGFFGTTGWNAYQQSKLNTANDAFLTLQKNPKDSDALGKLQSNNPKLYELFKLKQAMASKSADKLKALESSADPIVSAIAKYHAGALEGKVVDTDYYHDLTVIEEAYLDLKAGKKSEAKNKLSLISEGSPVSKIAQLLEHYTIEVK
jgi:hypothetical protein